MGLATPTGEPADETDEDLVDGFLEDHMLAHSIKEQKKEVQHNERTFVIIKQFKQLALREGLEKRPAAQVETFGFTIEGKLSGEMGGN